MLARSTCSVKIDPYRAGIEIGEALKDISPEVVFLFSSIHYEGSTELAEGIYEVLENPDLILLGGTGDGFYERSRVSDVGAAALGLNSQGRVRWHLSKKSGLEERPFEVTRDCLRELHGACGSSPPALYFLVSDFRSDSSEILRALQEEALAPVVGGSAGDDFEILRCFVYANREVGTDCLVVLAAEGDLGFEVFVSAAAEAVGNEGVITEADGPRISSIDGRPAIEFLQQQLGKALHELDRGNVTLLVQEAGAPEERRFRSIGAFDIEGTGAVTVFGGIEQGNRVQLCLTRTDHLIEGVQALSDHLDEIPFHPVAGLIVSCSGRKQVLGEDIEKEVLAVTRSEACPPCLAGFTTLGEYGPVRVANGYSRPLFHNMSFLLLLLG